MAKRKITVTIDEDVLDGLQAASPENLSALVNDALRARVAEWQRRAALRSLLDELVDVHGPVPDDELAAAHAEFDELERSMGIGASTAA